VAALARAALCSIDPSGADRDGIVRPRMRHLVAVAAVSDLPNEHGVDVEPEAERQHARTVAPQPRLGDRLPALPA
jgi:hypothetical protein